GDGLVDFPDDPGCETASDQSEADACPSGPGCPQCGNGADDDGDGLVDFPADPGCAMASDTGELELCNASAAVQTLPESGASGVTPLSGSSFTPSCRASSASEVVYHYPLTRELTSITFTTEGSPGDTVTSV